MKDPNPEIFDAIIIGSGQAGNPLAFSLAAKKWKVALVEKAKFGGTCVNTGCTPTKAFVDCRGQLHWARICTDFSKTWK